MSNIARKTPKKLNKSNQFDQQGHYSGSFASESVCAGHPDKIADQISDAILDAILAQDPNGRTAIETLVAKNRIILAGETSTTAKINIEKVIRQLLRRLGYIEPSWGFCFDSPIENYLHQQSSEIAIGVDNDGAGDQGLMFGYATDETKEYLPLPIAVAHKLVKALDDAREKGTLPYIRPDGKAQVVVKYINNKPVSIEHVTIAIPHNELINLSQVRSDVYNKIIKPILEIYGFNINIKDIIVNGTGVWNTPGPGSDSGLTGRKIVVDGYGGFARVGGGAFSGKDPSKVDRSGAYAARYIAKNLVANGLAKKAEVALAYYIGAKNPINFSINTFGTSEIPNEEIKNLALKLLNPSVKNIIKKLDLKKPIYLQTASYGHFGKPYLPWEKVVKI